MCRCANTEAASAYYARLDKRENDFNDLQEAIEPFIEDIENLHLKIMDLYKDYGFELDDFNRSCYE